MKAHFKEFNYYEQHLKFKGDLSLTFDYSNIITDGFIVQGFCTTDKYYLISAYCSLKDNKRNSRIYFYIKESGDSCGYVVLDNKAHVGGISFDYRNRVLFVTGSKGKINVYRYDSLIKSLGGNYLEHVDSDINISYDLPGKVSAATINFYDNSLYICICSCSGVMLKYDLSYVDDKIIIVNKTLYNCLPPCIQGLVVFNYCGKKYFLVSQSYRRLKSIIKLYDFDNNFLGQRIIGFRGLEGIDMDSNGNIHGVFEFGSTKSFVLNIKNINRSINKFLEKKYFDMGTIHQKKLDIGK